MGEVPFDFQRYFDTRIGHIGRHRCGFDGKFQAHVYPAEARFGDFQANGVLPYAKSTGRNPRQLAQILLDAMLREKDFSGEIATAEIAGAGFINLKLSPSTIDRWLRHYNSAEKLQSSLDTQWRGRTTVVDYSCPNSAKQMHVGHLRSLVIGDALQRILCFCGANVIRDNHLGDWGTQFGILLRQLRAESIDLDTVPQEDALELLEELYRRGNAAVNESKDALEEARAELVALQEGDGERMRLWRKINDLSYASFQEIYNLTAVQFDHILGESFYRDSVGRVYEELQECHIAVENLGALVVFHPEHERFREQPFIVRKSDGASNYASTDLATVLYRMEHFSASDIIYVTDARQRDHFEQLILTVDKWFRAKNYPMPRLHHVYFGTVCGTDGKAIKTRAGGSVRLKQLFAEAIARARVAVEEKNPDFDEELREKIARAVGVGAIKYGDLSQNRSSDYIFSLDKMLALEGNTAPYLQYAVARIHAIFRKRTEENFSLSDGQSIAPQTQEEHALARQLLRFPLAIRQTIEELRPHLLCNYLYDLAGTFSTFYNANRIFCENSSDTQRRIIFCERTLLILKLGLRLLGIETLERM
ncbi:MAG: arginine--tRNA ligase [Puniceicoccales bacterium]|jgi:arginyl-tRNA synthetase|nr:arginine--tRNA ligase [Puniceicoccales bacterium]